MPIRVEWSPAYRTGDESIDTQHQGLLAQCNVLADVCAGPDDEAGAARFNAAYQQLTAQARTHFDAELAQMAREGNPELEDHRAECAEFGYLASDIATAENFDRLELQRFIALWCLGHVRAAADEAP
jgi:hemerythrin-like metal-binding protein